MSDEEHFQTESSAEEQPPSPPEQLESLSCEPASTESESEPPALPPIATSAISIILIAKQRRGKVKGVLEAWVAFLETLETVYDIYVVDEDDEKPVAASAEELLASKPHIHFLDHPGRRGFGAALRAGLESAKHPLVFYSTCDSQYQPSDLALLLQWIDRVHVVSGYRSPGRTGRHGRPIGKSWRDRVYRWAIRLLFAVRLSDLNCRFLLARREIFARIPIQSDGPFAHAEVLAKANFLGCLMTELPVRHEPPRFACSVEPVVGEARRVFSNPDFGPPVLPQTS